MSGNLCFVDVCARATPSTTRRGRRPSGAPRPARPARPPRGPPSPADQDGNRRARARAAPWRRRGRPGASGCRRRGAGSGRPGAGDRTTRPAGQRVGVEERVRRVRRRAPRPAARPRGRRARAARRRRDGATACARARSGSANGAGRGLPARAPDEPVALAHDARRTRNGDAPRARRGRQREDPLDVAPRSRRRPPRSSQARTIRRASAGGSARDRDARARRPSTMDGARAPRASAARKSSSSRSRVGERGERRAEARVELAPRGTARAAGGRGCARGARSAFVRSTANGSSRSARIASHVGARHAEERPEQPAAHAAACRRARAGRRRAAGGGAPSRPDRRACGRSRCESRPTSAAIATSAR